MKRLTLASSCLFWTLLLALSLGQERRDPTVPGALMQSKLSQAPKEVEALPELVLKALVLSDTNHGTALLQTSSGMRSLKLDRERPSEVTVERCKFTITDFSRNSITLTHSGREMIIRVGK